MENTFIWILVFAGAAIGLLATFLIASERELRVKRREIEALAARVLGNDSESPADKAVQASGSEGSSELVAKNNELMFEVSMLRENLDKSAEELEAAKQQAQSARLELETFRAESGSLHEVVVGLKRQLAANESQLGNFAGQQQENEHRLESEITGLREVLEEKEARLRELNDVQGRLLEAESRMSIFMEEQQALSRQLAESTNELAQAHDKLRELEATQSRLKEMEGMCQEMRAHKDRLEEEIAHLRNRLDQSKDSRRMVETLQRSLSELNAKQAGLTEQTLKFQEELAAVGKLFNATNGSELLAESPRAANG